MVGHYKMSMTLPWAYYALRKKHVPSRKQIPKEVQNSFVMHNFCQCQQPSVKISKDRKGAFKKKVLGRKLREKLFQKLPNLVNARKPAECYKKQWKSHGCYFKDWTVKKYFKKFMKKSINNMLNNKINDIMVDEGEFEHIRDDGNYWGMQVRLLHTSLVRRLERPLIFYCGQDRKDRWLLKEVSVILNSNFVAVDPKFKNSSGNYKWLQTVQETGKPKPKVQITEEDIVLFRKKDMDDDSDDEEESGEETPKKDMDDDSDDEEESGEETPRKPETSKKRPGESSKTPNPKKARITPQQKTDEKKVGDQANADNFKETPTESFVCSFCNKSFGSEVAVDSHINNVHGGKFTCPSCHKSLGSEAALKSHSRSKHDGK